MPMPDDALSRDFILASISFPFFEGVASWALLGASCLRWPRAPASMVRLPVQQQPSNLTRSRMSSKSGFVVSLGFVAVCHIVKLEALAWDESIIATRGRKLESGLAAGAQTTRDPSG